MFKKQSSLLGMIGLLAVCCIVGVFAYWTQELLVHNQFEVASYDTKIEEEFRSPDNWLPGIETNKDVWIKNNSSIPVFTKVEIKQDWIRKENVLDVDGTVISPEKGEAFSLTFDVNGHKEYAAQIQWGTEVMLLASGEKSDVSLGLPIADTVADADGKWLLVSDVPDSEGKLLLYYIGTIAQNDRSPKLVDAVTMNPQVQPSVLVKKVTYNEQSGQWETTSILNKTGGYDCARYTMSISATTVQATKDAVKNVFGTAQDVSTVVEHLTDLAGDESTVSATENVKKLYFEEQNGKMVWNTEKGDSGNWFMDFANMVPGGEYKDGLKIENGSKKTYKLYMQAEVVEQTELQDQLLEKIQMTVSSCVWAAEDAGSETLDGTLTLQENFKNKGSADVFLRGSVGENWSYTEKMARL